MILLSSPFNKTKSRGSIEFISHKKRKKNIFPIVELFCWGLKNRTGHLIEQNYFTGG